MKTRAPFLYEQNSSVIVDRSTCIISTADRTVKSHDSGNSTVDFFCGFFFVGLYISNWVCSVEVDRSVYIPKTDGQPVPFRKGLRTIPIGLNLDENRTNFGQNRI